MPTKREREYYRMGFRDGMAEELKAGEMYGEPIYRTPSGGITTATKPRTRRKLSAWNKFVKANAKKPRFRLRSGAPNLKKLGVAFRKTPAERKKKRR